MGLFDWFFNDTEKVKVKAPKSLPPISNNAPLNNKPACQVCNEPLEDWQKTRKFDKKRFHNKCLKKLKKQARNMQFN